MNYNPRAIDKFVFETASKNDDVEQVYACINKAGAQQSNESLQIEWLQAETMPQKKQILNRSVALLALSGFDGTVQCITFPISGTIADGQTEFCVGNQSHTVAKCVPIKYDIAYLIAQMFAFLPSNVGDQDHWVTRICTDGGTLTESEKGPMPTFDCPATVGLVPLMLPCSTIDFKMVGLNAEEALADLPRRSVAAVWLQAVWFQYRHHKGHSLTPAPGAALNQHHQANGNVQLFPCGDHVIESNRLHNLVSEDRLQTSLNVFYGTKKLQEEYAKQEMPNFQYLRDRLENDDEYNDALEYMTDEQAGVSDMRGAGDRENKRFKFI